jgi:hypothetical protein
LLPIFPESRAVGSLELGHEGIAGCLLNGVLASLAGFQVSANGFNFGFVQFTQTEGSELVGRGMGGTMSLWHGGKTSARIQVPPTDSEEGKYRGTIPIGSLWVGSFQKNTLIPKILEPLVVFG